MLVTQQNYGKGYKYIVATIEVRLGFDTEIVYIQELFFRNRSISHFGYNLYQPLGADNQKDIRVLTVVRKAILNKVIIDNQTDLVHHLYCSILDMKKLPLLSRKVLRKTRVVNLYNNKVGGGLIQQEPSPTVQQAIKDISWRQIIMSRVL